MAVDYELLARGAFVVMPNKTAGLSLKHGLGAIGAGGASCF